MDVVVRRALSLAALHVGDCAVVHVELGVPPDAVGLQWRMEQVLVAVLGNAGSA